MNFSNRPNPLIQIAILFGVVVLSLFLCVMIVALALPLFGVSDATAFLSSMEAQTKNTYASLFAQAMSSAVGMFLLPSIVFSQVLRYNYKDFFKTAKMPSFLVLSLAFVIIVCGGIFINLIVELSQQIPLSDSLAFLRNGQENTDALLQSFFEVKTSSHFLLLAFCLAFLPALAEEFFFRGVLQNLFLQMNIKPVMAMLLAGVVFSTMHMQFDNFIAISLMGFVLGWLYYYSGSIWVNVFAHFINNLSVVLLKYAYFSEVLQEDWTASENQPEWYITVSAGIFMFVGLWFMRKLSNEEKVE